MMKKEDTDRPRKMGRIGWITSKKGYYIRLKPRTRVGKIISRSICNERKS